MPSAPAPTAAADVIVVGGGVIGLAVAEELARRGKRVAVYDRGRPGSEASWAAGGMLAAEFEFERAGPFQQLAFASRAMWPDYAARLLADGAGDVRLRREGTLAVAFSARELAALRTRLDGRTFGGRVEWLDAAAAREREPALVPTIAGAAWLRDDLVCENRALLFALLRAARTRGISMHADTPATLWLDGGRVRGVIAKGERIAAPLVVNAAGAWASQLGLALPELKPVRGQMLGFSTQQPDALRHVVRWDEGYAVPRSGGRIVVGSTVEPDSGFAKGNTPDAIERLTAAFRSALPGIAAERKHAWSGLRPASADELPILGFAAEGLLYACGHYRNGILLTPVTAQAIADLAEGKRPALALDAFSPSRPALAAASIVVNGSARSIAPGTTVAALLSELALKRQGVAVAINEEVVRRGEWDSTVLKRSDRVEIIHAVGGG